FVATIGADSVVVEAAEAGWQCRPRTGKLSRSHPLDQLSPQEVQAASDCCRKHAARDYGVLRFNSVMLQASEPPKAQLLAYEAGRAGLLPRLAQCILIAPQYGEAGLVLEAVVDLSALLWAARGVAGGARMVTWKELPGVQPMTTPDDNFYAEEIMKADPGLRALLLERYGVTDMALVACDTWACHGAPEHLNHRRLMQGFLYLRTRAGDNEYAHPLDLVPIVDLNSGQVVHIDKYSRAPPAPMKEHNYHRDLLPPDLAWRTDLKPLDIVQPLGPSFKVQGSLVQWQKWQLRVGFTAREGLVLHGLGYQDAGRLRPVLHRASLVEMIVPYGDPNYPYVRKSALDVGDYGMGLCANSLELGCDCLGHIHYFDAVLNDSQGAPVLLRKAVCMHEEDAGILHKHYDCRTGHVETRRSRRLVISSISTFMNYEYCSYWYLYQVSGGRGLGGHPSALKGHPMQPNGRVVMSSNQVKSVVQEVPAGQGGQGQGVQVSPSASQGVTGLGARWLDKRIHDQGHPHLTPFWGLQDVALSTSRWLQDGAIGFELKLTGILSTSMAPLGEQLPRHGVRVAQGVNATVHQASREGAQAATSSEPTLIRADPNQGRDPAGLGLSWGHFFCMRLDPAIDDPEGGRQVVVSEVTARPLPPGPGNPHANGFIMHERDLLDTDQAQCEADFGGARCWKMKNPSVINPVSGEPVAYRLLPGVTPHLMAQEGSLVRKRGLFATKNLWVTPHADDQRYPAGEHVVQSKECMGLGRWTQQVRSLAGADPVVWYSFGVTHNPRIEDFPIMPVEVVGFQLKPASFFTANPALDVPPDRNTASQETPTSSPYSLRPPQPAAAAAPDPSAAATGVSAGVEGVGGGGGGCCARPCAPVPTLVEPAPCLSRL
ncbi:hypothetical protein QJQ45_023557, partial [Haematococcus lacustris]